MLTIIFKDKDAIIDNNKLIKDVERAFESIKLTGSEEERVILKNIEQAEFIDELSFRDRFGFKLYTSELSTGCKAALCVLHYPNKIIDTLECRLNARDAIVSFCKTGSILMRNNGVTIQKISDTIEVSLDGYNFTDIDKLNEYINDVRPFPWNG